MMSMVGKRDDGSYDYEENDEMSYLSNVRAQQENLRRTLRRASRVYNKFNQSEVWVNAEGRYVRIEDMSAEYAENTLHFLEDHATQDMELYFLWKNRNEVTDTVFDELTEEVAVRWVRGTALYQALEAASGRPF